MAAAEEGGGGLGEDITPSLSSRLGDPRGHLMLVSVLTTRALDFSPSDRLLLSSSLDAAAFEVGDCVEDEAEFFVGVCEGLVVPPSSLPCGG